MTSYGDLKPRTKDRLSDNEVQRFGSYHQLTKLRDFRYQPANHAKPER